MALLTSTATAYAPPAHPWCYGGLVRARVCTTAFVGDGRAAAAKGRLGVVACFSASGGFNSVVGASAAEAAGHALAGLGLAAGPSAPRGWHGRGATAASKGLGVVACYSASGGFNSVVGASAAEAAGHALAGLGLAASPSTPRDRHGRGATSAAQAGLSLAGIGANHAPAGVLTVACTAGRSPAPMDPGEDGEKEISWSTYEYLKAVEDFQEKFRAAALFHNKDLVISFKETAERGIVLIDDAMSDTTPFALDLQDMITASVSLRRVSMEASQGYVLASSVVDASTALHKLLYVFNPDRAMPPYPRLVPYMVFNEEITPYFTSILDGFRAIIDAAEGKD